MTKRFLPSACSLLYLSWTMFIEPSCSQNAPAQTCDPGWFGSNCQYKCRYLSWIFDRDRTCAYSDCEVGWFGPGCQYEDLSYNRFTLNLRSWYHDHEGLTCEQKNKLKQLIVNLPSEFPFTWLRLQVSDPSLLHEFQVTFPNKRNKTTVSCKNARNATVNKKTLDIHCDLDVLVQTVILTGDGVKSLCSLHVSGGRNVAIRQNATQSSNYSGSLRNYSFPMHAVDGNTNTFFLNKSCTRTNSGDRSPNWSVKLSSENYINRYVLYNRLNSYDRLLGFTLTSFTKDHKRVFNYTDNRLRSHGVYTITNWPKTPPVSKVNIHAKSYNVSEPILTLCEVELYGDTACPPSRYGRECEHTCNCAVNNESCFVSTGGCPSGCAAGFQGEGCDKSCDFGKYGSGCSSNCSQFCVQTNSSPCFPTNGTCVHGCVNGYWGSECENMTILMDSNSIPAAAVVFPSIVVVLLFVVAVLGVVLWRRRRSTIFNDDDNHYDKVDNTCLKQTITPKVNKPKQTEPVNYATTSKENEPVNYATTSKQKEPVNYATTSKQTTQTTAIQNNPPDNVSDNDDSLLYEVPVDTELLPSSTTDKVEPKLQSQANRATAPKQPEIDMEIQHNPDNIYYNTEPTVRYTFNN